MEGVVTTNLSDCRCHYPLDLYVIISGIDRWLLPRPHEIAIELFASRALIAERMTETLTATAIGLLAAIIASLILATWMDLSRRVRQTVYPLLVVSQSIPYFVIAPLLIIWFGFGLTPKVLVVMLVCLFPMTVNLADGYMQVDRDILRGCNPWEQRDGKFTKWSNCRGRYPRFFRVENCRHLQRARYRRQ